MQNHTVSAANMAAITSLATIQDLVNSAARKARNRALVRRCRDLAVGLYFLARNWKPCLLFDFGPATDDLLLSLSRQIIGEDGLLLTLNDGDRFLASRRHLLAHINSILAASPPPPVLDVSFGSVWPPRQVDAVAWTQLTGGLDQIQAAIRLGQQQVVGVELPASCNLATMFGLLLGYPVTYWTHHTQPRNSLSGQELAVYSVTFGGGQAATTAPIAFSVPVAAMMLEPVAAAVRSWGCHLWPYLVWSSSSSTETYSGQNAQCVVADRPMIFQFDSCSTETSSDELVKIKTTSSADTSDRENIQFNCSVQVLPCVVL